MFTRLDLYASETCQKLVTPKYLSQKLLQKIVIPYLPFPSKIRLSVKAPKVNSTKTKNIYIYIYEHYFIDLSPDEA